MNKDIIAWLGYVVASPLAVLMLAAFLLGACAPVDTCPDLRCEYEHGGEAPTEAPAPSPEPEPEPEKGEKGKDKGDKGHGKDKGDKGDKGKGKGHDKGDRDGDDD